MSLFQCRTSPADLNLIGGSKQSRTLFKNRDMMSYDSAFIIDQSPSGLFESRTDLKRP